MNGQHHNMINGANRIDVDESPTNPTRHQQFKLRGLKVKSFPETSQTNDEIHKTISLCPVLLALIDTPHFQRLRHLNQLGASHLTYMCTTHKRFEHSLGVAHLAEEMVQGIKERQPLLGITEKDALCVKIAGLLHDIGHGPFSHVYDGIFRKQLEQAEDKGLWLDQEFDMNQYNGLPPVMNGWQHEDGSLMMIDALLAYLGLRIDRNNLDEPLAQVGDGIDARCFGICVDKQTNTYYDGNTPLPIDLVLTSRDWIFIKECIVGGPLPLDGMSIDSMKNLNQFVDLVGRDDPYKEFLYDIVSNRHSGLDVDKMDYLARDGRRANRSSGAINAMLMKKAYVAWGECSNPKKCWKCKHNDLYSKPSTEEHDGDHLMICYPNTREMVQNVMTFFQERYDAHQNLYTHKTTNAGCYMICDILVLADPYFRLVATTKDGNQIKLPISRSNTDPRCYLKLKDSILDLIENTTNPNLQRARDLVTRFNARKLYKKVGEQEIESNNGKDFRRSWQKRLWQMEESRMIELMIKWSKIDGVAVPMKEDDFIIEKRTIHHGMKGSNPLNSMRFLPKHLNDKLRQSPEHLPKGEKVSETTYHSTKPTAFQERTIRVYCRREDAETCGRAETCFYQLKVFLKKENENDDGNDDYGDDDDDDDDDDNDGGDKDFRYNQPPELSQSPPVSNAASRSSYHNNDDDDNSNMDLPRNRKRNGGSLYSAAVKRRMDFEDGEEDDSA